MFFVSLIEFKMKTYIKMLNNFYDILKNKETIINIDSLINYLTINKYNFKERYDFLMKVNYSNVDENLLVDNQKQQDISDKIVSYYKINLNLSCNYNLYYYKYLDEEKKSYDFNDFDDWVNLLIGNDYVFERIGIKKNNEEFINDLVAEFSLIFDKKISDYKFLVNIPVDKFSCFYKKFKNSNVIENWLDFFLTNNFSDLEILEIADENIDINKFISTNKNWNKNFLRKYCYKITNINEVFNLNISWNIDDIDFVINSFKDENGKLTYVEDEFFNEKRHSTIFTEKQLSCIDWNIENIIKYFDFITEEFVFEYNSNQKFDKYEDVYTEIKFMEEFYEYKLNWNIEELSMFKDNINWYLFSKNGDFWNDGKIFSFFMDKIIHNNLILNKKFKINKEYVLNNYKKINFENLIESDFQIDLEIFLKYNIETNFRGRFNEFQIERKIELFYNLIKKGNLCEDLIIYLSDDLSQNYNNKFNYLKRSGGDLDSFSIGYYEDYWRIISSNPKIKWNDNLIKKFYKNLVFEDLKTINISYKTIDKLYYYKRSFRIYHYDTGKEDSDKISEYKTELKNILINCNIYDLNKDVFLEREFKYFGLWFNENSINKNILEIIIN